MELQEIQLSGDKHEPQFNEEDYFLAKIGDGFYFGHMHKVWFGWNFADGWGSVGHQYDPPGTNHSGWEKVWRLVV